MNLPSNTELSLYQLTQELPAPPKTLIVSSATFKSLVNAIVDFLCERQIVATLWVKLPQTERWLAEIEQYARQGSAEQIYLCTLGKETVTSSTNLSALSGDRISTITPLLLETSSQLKREFFLIVVSSQFSTLVLAQRQAQATGEGIATQTQSSRLKLVYSFDPVAIAQTITAIKQGITITDNTPVTLIADNSTPLSISASPDADALMDLLHKQLHHSDVIQTTKVASSQTDSPVQSLTESLNFNKELLTNLTRELSLSVTNMKTALRLIDSTQNKKEQRQRYLQLLQQQCDRQNAFLSGLQELAQFNVALDDSESSLKLEEIIPGIVSIYQPIAEEKGIILGYTIPAGLPAVNCSSNSLRQILLNLLNNSLKFTPPKGRVYVQVSLNNETVELTVTDTGVGIDRNDLPNIFESFYRGRNANNPEMMSAGLGLTIVKQLLKRCGGSIQATSRIGKGSTFKVSLPAIAS
jgi:two-component system, OmpR family, phosphate regulon sensor histidine kinase PhoR